jgi:hypothetical protein
MSQSTSLLLRVWTSPGTCASSDWPAHGSGSGRGLLVPVAMGKVCRMWSTSRVCLLFPGDFDALFDKLESIVVGIGKPGGSLKREGDKMVYRYSPFHEISFTSVVAEPLVFFRDATSGTTLLINPDFWFFFKLEEKASGMFTEKYLDLLDRIRGRGDSSGPVPWKLGLG